MPDYTTNYALIKPKKSENYDIDDVTRKNMDTIDTQLANKVDKILGKGLSSCDFTEQYKTKLDRLNNYDDTDIKNSISNLKNKQKEQDTTIDDINNDINLANRNLANVIQLAMTNQKNIDTEHETNTQQDKDIANLKTENEELKAENERLRQDMNAYPSNEASGEYITLNDSADSRFNKFKIIGKSTQKTRSGKNIFNMNNVSNNHNGISYSYENGIFTLNGTLQEGNYVEYQYFVNIPIKQGEYYRISFKELSGTKTGDGDFFIHAGSSINDEKTWGWIQTKDVLAKTPSGDGNIYNIVIYGVKAKNEQLVFNNYKFQVQIEEVPNANSPATEYEEYGAMPSPEFPSEIKNITTNVNVINTNENLVLSGYSTPKSDTDFWSTSSSGFTPLEDGWGRFELDNTKGNNNNYVSAFISFKKFKNIIKLKTSYKLLVEFRNINMSGSSNEDYMCITTGSGSEPFVNCQFYKNDLSKNLRYSKKLNPYPYDTNITHLFRSFLSVSPGNSTSLEVRISLLEENSTETEVKVENQEFVFPLAEGQVLREGDYLAEDAIHHKRKQIKIDISQFATGMPYKGIFSVSNNKIRWDYTSVKGICNYFNNAESEQVTENFSASQYINDNEFNFRMGNTKDRIYFKNSAFTTLEQWRDFFNNNEVIVEYECNEYVEAYTDEQKQVYDELVKTAKSYKTVTNIFSTNEISPKFEVNYRRDIDTYIDNKLANVNEQILNIAGGN